jgi:hypothetical protein
MDNISTITAVSGWALPRKWFAEEVLTAFPDKRVQIIYPQYPESIVEAKILLNQYPADLYIGYSLGSLWLLKYYHLLPDTCMKALLAPILSILEQDGLGGTTSENQLKYLFIRILRRSEIDITIKNFFSYCDLPVFEKIYDDIPDKETLLRGLKFLKSYKAKGEDAENFLSIVGENDIFINANLLGAYIPKLKVIKGIGHAPGNLLKDLAKRLDSYSNNHL